MSGLILFIVAVALLGVAILRLVSLPQRAARQSILPVHKEEIIPSVPPPFSADFFTVLYCPLPKPKQKQACGPAPSFSLCLRTYDSQACSALSGIKLRRRFAEASGQISQVQQTKRRPHQAERQEVALEIDPQYPTVNAPTIGGSR